MNAPAQMKQHADLRDYLAAERTFLAWVRTGLALMGFGFVVARFGLFLEQLRRIEHVASAETFELSLWFGTTLMIVGVLVNFSSAWRHVRLVRELDGGEPECSRSLMLAVLTAVFLALIGLAMAIYLVSVRHSASVRSQSSSERITDVVTASKVAAHWRSFHFN
jgi:putative membrane protein